MAAERGIEQATETAEWAETSTEGWVRVVEWMDEEEECEGENGSGRGWGYGRGGKWGGEVEGRRESGSEDEVVGGREAQESEQTG